SVEFSFDAPVPPTSTLPQVRWRVDGLGENESSGGAGEEDPGMSPGFNVNDFIVLDGTFTYAFDAQADAWQFVSMDFVPTPVPEPGTLAAVALGLGWLARRRRRS
ncbi:MAG TPA: PEP-CTERM sorting domain-containing protein, partial [Fimbriimonadaceae bacterium]|nr:PEP-CTERM sorting domain-containing protein [Fimbriimonadaceae bacterium]